MGRSQASQIDISDHKGRPSPLKRINFRKNSKRPLKLLVGMISVCGGYAVHAFVSAGVVWYVSVCMRVCVNNKSTDENVAKQQ